MLCGSEHWHSITFSETHSSQVFRWHRLFREPARTGGTGRFVPVVVEAAPGQEAGAAAMGPPSDDGVAQVPPAAGRVEIVLAGGRRVIVDRVVDPSTKSRRARLRTNWRPRRLRPGAPRSRASSAASRHANPSPIICRANAWWCWGRWLARAVGRSGCRRSART